MTPYRNLDYRNLVPLLDEYYELTQSCIVFDSGQFSHRSEYICNLIDYLNTEKGIISIALSSTSASKNTLYMSRLPDAIRARIHSLGLYHVYQTYVKLFSETLETLYVDPSVCSVIQYAALAVRQLQVKLIRALKAKLNCVIILDRSLFSSYLYTKTLTKDANLSDYVFFTNMRPLKLFFITSSRQKEQEKSHQAWQTYDNLKNMNQQLYQKLYDLECVVPDFKDLMTIVHEAGTPLDGDLDANMDFIKSHINQVL